jgi:hypothetical protein
MSGLTDDRFCVTQYTEYSLVNLLPLGLITVYLGLVTLVSIDIALGLINSAKTTFDITVRVGCHTVFESLIIGGIVIACMIVLRREVIRGIR